MYITLILPLCYLESSLHQVKAIDYIQKSMYLKPEMFNNMRRNMSMTGIAFLSGTFKLHHYIASTTGIPYLQIMSRELMVIAPSKREGIFVLNLIPCYRSPFLE